MPKLTVYVNEQVAARLEPFRDRMNLSEIAKSAIEERLRMEEEAAAGDVRTQVLYRLRAGDDRLRAIRQGGYDDGHRWAKDAASWQDMKNVSDWPPIDMTTQFARGGAEHGALVVMALVEIATSKGPDFSKTRIVPLSVKSAPADTSVPTRVAYYSGFAEGVRSVYDLVKGDVPTNTR